MDKNTRKQVLHSQHNPARQIATSSKQGVIADAASLSLWKHFWSFPDLKAVERFYLFVYYKPQPQLFLSLGHCSKPVSSHGVLLVLFLLRVCTCWPSTWALHLSLCMNFPNVPGDALPRSPYLCPVNRVTPLSVTCTSAGSICAVA